MLFHELQVLIPGLLSVGLENSARHEVILHLAIIPGGVDVVPGVIESLESVIGTSGNETGDGVGGGGGERITSVLVCIVMVLGKEDQLLLRSFRFHNPLLKKEFAKARLVPRLKGGILKILEGLLSGVVSFVSPRGVRPPIFSDEVLEVFLRVIVGFRDIDLVLFEPGSELLRAPIGVFWCTRPVPRFGVDAYEGEEN